MNTNLISLIVLLCTSVIGCEHSESGEQLKPLASEGEKPDIYLDQAKVDLPIESKSREQDHLTKLDIFYREHLERDFIWAITRDNGIEINRPKNVFNTDRWQIELKDVELKCLEWVLIEDMRTLSEEDINKLLQLPKLKRLGLRKIPPEFDLERIARIPTLKVFSADSGDLIGNRSINEVTFGSLESLGLYASTDEMCEYLNKFPRLKALSLGGGLVSDIGMQRIAKICPDLEYLHIALTKIGPESIGEIISLKHLRYLVVGETSFESKLYSHDEKCIPQLRDELPECEVLYGS